MTHYVNPLLHPLISPSPTLPSAPITPPSSAPSPYLNDTVSSAPDLPIAARFLRPSMSDLSPAHSPSPVDEHGRLAGWGENQMPDMDGSDSGHSAGPAVKGNPKAGRHSLPAMTREQQALYATTSSHASLASTLPAEPDRSRVGRLSSFTFKSRHPLRPAPSSTKLHKGSSQVPAEVLAPPPVPQALRDALEAVSEMLAGHEDLSNKLKEQWARAFPLVRGLAAIWSDQPWFLQVYARYILALEEALALLDLYLPTTHTPPNSSGFLGGSRKTKTPGLDKEQRKLAKALMRLEERAAEAGESSLSICLSKPLMRLGKLPLLMQNLLYHTDGVALEWEQTRAMALEVDALVRSIEDEKVEEEEREKTRDALARIEGINDKASREVVCAAADRVCAV